MPQRTFISMAFTFSPRVDVHSSCIKEYLVQEGSRATGKAVYDREISIRGGIVALSVEITLNDQPLAITDSIIHDMRNLLPVNSRSCEPHAYQRSLQPAILATTQNPP